MANCHKMQLARRRGYGTFKNLGINLEFYHNGGRYLGSSTSAYNDVKTLAEFQFQILFTKFQEIIKQFLDNNKPNGWDCKVSFDFGDSE